MSISLYSIFNLSKIIFSVLLGVIFLGEKITLTTLVGIIIVLIGLYLVNRISNDKENNEMRELLEDVQYNIMKIAIQQELG